MPRCNVDHFCLHVRIPDRLKDQVEMKELVGADATAMLNLLVSEGCRLDVVEFDYVPEGDYDIPWAGPEGSDILEFRNVFANTGEVAEALSLKPSEVVSMIDEGKLKGLKTPNGFYRLVLKDEKYDLVLGGDSPVSAAKQPRKIRGRGLKRMLWDALKEGLVPSSFRVSDIKKGLQEKNWRAGVHYSPSSIVSAVHDLILEGCVVVERDGSVKDRVWSYTPEQASSALSPSRSTVGAMKDQMVEDLAGEIVAQAKQRARELLGL